MNCVEWKEQFREWIGENWQDGEPSPQLPHQLSAHLQGCIACRLKYRTMALLIHGERLNAEAPLSLRQKIDESIRQKTSTIKFNRSRFPALIFPLAASALAVLAFFLIMPLFTPQPQSVTVRFLLAAPGASSVAVVGDWNEWNPKMDRLSDQDRDGVWEIELHLNKNNEYRYQFIIDGESWIPDPSSPLQVEDGFGGINSVLEI